MKLGFKTKRHSHNFSKIDQNTVVFELSKISSQMNTMR